MDGYELAIGDSSWDSDEVSAKHVWFNKKNGHRSRGGEIPVESLAALLALAIEERVISLRDISREDRNTLSNFFARPVAATSGTLSPAVASTLGTVEPPA